MAYLKKCNMCIVESHARCEISDNRQFPIEVCGGWVCNCDCRNPQITFIMPTINKHTLVDTIETVRNQTLPSWRLIVGGDGMFPVYSGVDHRISLVKIERKGEAGFMRNAINEFATTEWIAFLDDDDEIHPQYLEHFYTNKDDCDVMIFQMLNYAEILPPTGYHVIQHGRVGISFAMKRQLLLDHPFDGQGSGEDYRMLYTLQHSGCNIKFLDWLGYYVRPYLNR